MYLDFARRTQRCNPCRHPRSREFPRFTTCVYRSFLPGSHILPSLKEFLPEIHTHIYTISCICYNHSNAKKLNHIPLSSKWKGYLVCIMSSCSHVAPSTPRCYHNTFTSLTVLRRKTWSWLSIIRTGPSSKVPSASMTSSP